MTNNQITNKYDLEESIEVLKLDFNQIKIEEL